jgi:integrase/recombinase XerD
MTTSVISEILPPLGVDPLRLAAAAYLARFKGQSRVHTERDLRIYLRWCAERGLDPLRATRPHVELYVRWMQERQSYAASTVARRIAIVAGFYRTCVIDGVLEHSPAEYVRRPTVSTQSPTLGLSHLQFEAMLAAARDSSNVNDFALVCLLGLLGLRIFEATNLDISDLGEEHGHRVLRVVGKGNKIVLVPLPPAGRPRGRSCHRRPHRRTIAPESGRRADGPPRRHPPAAPAPGRRRGADRPDAPAHAAAHVRHDDARRRGGSARHPDRRPARRPAHHDALRPRPHQSRPAPELRARCLHVLRHVARMRPDLPMSG